MYPVAANNLHNVRPQKTVGFGKMQQPMLVRCQLVPVQHGLCRLPKVSPSSLVTDVKHAAEAFEPAVVVTVELLVAAV